MSFVSRCTLSHSRDDTDRAFPAVESMLSYFHRRRISILGLCVVLVSPRTMYTDDSMRRSSSWNRTTSIERRQIDDMSPFLFLATLATLNRRTSSLVEFPVSTAVAWEIESSPRPQRSTKGNLSSEIEALPAECTRRRTPDRQPSDRYTRASRHTDRLSIMLRRTILEDRSRSSTRSPRSK